MLSSMFSEFLQLSALVGADGNVVVILLFYLEATYITALTFYRQRKPVSWRANGFSRRLQLFKGMRVSAFALYEGDDS